MSDSNSNSKSSGPTSSAAQSGSGTGASSGNSSGGSSGISSGISPDISPVAVASAPARRLATALIVIFALACLVPGVTPAEGLLVGVALALIFGNPLLAQTKKLTPHLLSLSIIGLGFGMNLLVVGKVGFQGIGYTVVSIAFVFIAGTLLGRLFKIERDTSLLITVGTAICGGSAIAAVSPVIRAKSHETSVALGTVFMLNAIALMIFPAIGHHFNLSEAQFGLWSALAIHDTSSVVGATSLYGPHALEIGTTVKLARALWIVPVALMIGWLRSREATNGDVGKGSFKKPWFILGFILAAALVTFIPELQAAGHKVEAVAKQLLILTLFLIGASLTRETLRAVGFRPFFQAVALWLLISVGTLSALLLGWLHSLS